MQSHESHVSDSTLDAGVHCVRDLISALFGFSLALNTRPTLSDFAVALVHVDFIFSFAPVSGLDLEFLIFFSSIISSCVRKGCHRNMLNWNAHMRFFEAATPPPIAPSIRKTREHVGSSHDFKTFIHMLCSA